MRIKLHEKFSYVHKISLTLNKKNFRTSSGIFLRELSKVHSACPEKNFGKNKILKKIPAFSKKLFFRCPEELFREKIQNYNLSECHQQKFVERKSFGSVIENAFYVSNGTFWVLKEREKLHSEFANTGSENVYKLKE